VIPTSGDRPVKGIDKGVIALALALAALMVLLFVSLWRIHEKAGQPGWAAIIPIYNVVVLLRIAGKPLWWIILLIIPLVNIIVWVIVSVAIANNFGRGTLFGIGLLVLGIIFYPILAFGDATYQAPAAE